MFVGAKSLDERLYHGKNSSIDAWQALDDKVGLMRTRKELDDLSDVYSVLREDAKSIIIDLKGGIRMWREAAYGTATIVGFIIILILTAVKYGPTPDTLEGLMYVIAASITAVAMAVISARGFRKYFQLKKKYSPLFERAKKL